MKIIQYSDERTDGSKLTFGANDFHYELDLAWAKWDYELDLFPAMDACVDAKGFVYVALDDPEHPIAVLNPDGELIQCIGKGLFQRPHGITCTPSGNLLCADMGLDAHVVRELTPDGELIRDFGTLHCPSKTGYDIDTVRNINKNLSTAHDKTIRSGTDLIVHTAGPFCRPTEMIQVPSGEYYAADGYGNAAVHKFSADGTLLKTWGSPGSEPGQFRLVHGICADPLGRIWVSDRENKRAQVFSPDGELLAVISGGFMRVVSFWCDGEYMYVGEHGGFSIVDMDFRLVARLGDGGALFRNNGMTGDANKNLYICSHFKGVRGQGLLKLVRV